MNHTIINLKSDIHLFLREFHTCRKLLNCGINIGSLQAKKSYDWDKDENKMIIALNNVFTFFSFLSLALYLSPSRVCEVENFDGFMCIYLVDMIELNVSFYFHSCSPTPKSYMYILRNLYSLRAKIPRSMLFYSNKLILTKKNRTSIHTRGYNNIHVIFPQELVLIVQ